MTKDENILKRQKYMSIKTLSLNNLTAKQHMLMALCRDVSLLPPLYYSFTSMKKCFHIIMMDSPIVKLYEPQSFRETLTRFWQTYMLNNNLTTVVEIIESTTTSSHNVATPTSETILNTVTPGSLVIESLITARASEYIFCALWCLVALYLSYAILDSLMVRWIVKYSTVAAILRMFSMSLIFVSFELLLLNSLSPENNYFLHTWILISCILTCGYIWQSYLTSDLNYIRRTDDLITINKKLSSSDTPDDTILVSNSINDSDSQNDLDSDSSDSNSNSIIVGPKKKKSSKDKLTSSSFKFNTKRTIDLYNITVFCVVPVGLASFITMVGLLRNLFIQRLDIEQLARIVQESVH
ncbi:hypothetical protein C6P45_001089 [Maudiozyma exigua]|uniref:N-glycosylation protein EOS1 n=1 Tax=Maudiozyma exigua TaxID=34358 RepID=A0A9P6W396_MAUEX|nr:hypothetical protein C6P45_001089 [Kazachstania exigua]